MDFPGDPIYKSAAPVFRQEGDLIGPDTEKHDAQLSGRVFSASILPYSYFHLHL